MTGKPHADWQKKHMAVAQQRDQAGTVTQMRRQAACWFAKKHAALSQPGAQARIVTQKRRQLRA